MGKDYIVQNLDIQNLENVLILYKEEDMVMKSQLLPNYIATAFYREIENCKKK